MRTYIRIHNIRTGDYETIDFPNADKAFDFYWGLSDKGDPDIEFELVTVA